MTALPHHRYQGLTKGSGNLQAVASSVTRSDMGLSKNLFEDTGDMMMEVFCVKLCHQPWAVRHCWRTKNLDDRKLSQQLSSSFSRQSLMIQLSKRKKIHRTLSSWTTDLYDTRSFSQLFSRQARVQHRLDRGDRLRAWWPECTSPKPWFLSGSIEVDIPGRSWKILGEYLEYLRMNRNYTWTTDWNPFRSDCFGGWNNDQDNRNQFNMYTTVYWCLLYIWVLHCDLPTSAARFFHIFPKFRWIHGNLALGDVNLIVPDGRVEHHSTWRWNHLLGDRYSEIHLTQPMQSLILDPCQILLP